MRKRKVINTFLYKKLIVEESFFMVVNNGNITNRNH
jgi:hypothetical protein